MRTRVPHYISIRHREIFAWAEVFLPTGAGKEWQPFPSILSTMFSCFFGPGFPGAGSSSAPCRGPTPGEATNQSVEAVCALLCSTTHTCSTYLYQDPASFASSSGINFGGNCVLRDRFEDGGYLNEVQDTGGYQAKHCIRWNPAAPRSKSFFASPRDIDVSQVNST